MKQETEQTQKIQPEQPEQIQQETQPDKAEQTAQEPEFSSQTAKTNEPLPEQVAEQVPPEQKETTATFSGGYDDNGILTLDAFQAGFIGAFDVAGDFTGLKSFPVKDYEIAGANKTAEKLYNIALKYPAFRFLIDRKSYWLYDWSLVVGFLAMKTNDVLEEKFNYSIKNKLFGWLKWNKGKTVNESGFLGRLVAGKRQKQGN